MKNERRHELQQNELADWIEKKYASIAPYGKSIATVCVAAVVLYAAYSFISSRNLAAKNAEWDNLDSIHEADLAGVIKRRESGTPLGDLARFKLANDDLTKGINALIRENDYDSTKKLIQESLDNYSAVANSTSDLFLKQMAICGKARAHESLNQLDAAKKEYEALLKFEKNAIFDDYAKQRIADISRGSVKQFYTTLTQMASQPKPKSGTPDPKPPFSLDNFGDPTKSSLIDPSKFGPLPGTPADNFDAGAKKPDGETKPAEPAKPSDEKSATEPAKEKADDKSAPAPTNPPPAKTDEPKAESK